MKQSRAKAQRRKGRRKGEVSGYFAPLRAFPPLRENSLLKQETRN